MVAAAPSAPLLSPPPPQCRVGPTKTGHWRRVNWLISGVCEGADARHQPRLHDLRHAFAVHRLVSWYRDGADVQRLLPKLSTYLGHVHIAGTQRYLTLTPELLRQASLRFEHYAVEPSHE